MTEHKQIIVCAANRHKSGVIFCGARHCDNIMRAQANAAGVRLQESEQGFIDNFGEFLTRQEALVVAKSSGQHLMLEHCTGDKLFSEGIY